MSNARKSALLGCNFSTASQRLRKLVMWSLVQRLSVDVCFRCGEKIEDVDDLSIEHKEPRQSAPHPRAAFFDLENIAFSHLGCNAAAAESAAGKRPVCPKGHPYDAENTLSCNNGKRRCRVCHAAENRLYMRKRRSQGKVGRAAKAAGC